MEENLKEPEAYDGPFGNANQQTDQVQNNVGNISIGTDSQYNTITGGSISEGREITITPLNSGYNVRVGCQMVAVESTETLIDKLSQYLRNPSRVERLWFSNTNRNKLENIT